MERGYPDRDTFCICGRDLSRIAGRIRVTRRAEDLTTLARRFIEDRLESGPPRDAAIAHPVTEGDRVRLWDPADAWHAGDRGLFAVPAPGEASRSYSPCVGEVMQVRGKGVVVRLDGEPGTRIYGAAPALGDALGVVEWRQSIEDLVRDLLGRTDRRSRVDLVFWCYGETIVATLLTALRNDHRFVSLEGRWYLRSAATVPSVVQLDGLAHAMLSSADRPMAVSELLRWVPPPVPAGDGGLFGLALGLHQRPDVFANVDSDTRSRWVLAGPPPGAYIARYAAYDPESFALLCEPGESLDEAVVQRLWSLDFLGTVAVRRIP